MKRKHTNITLSFPADLNALLHAKFPQRGISNYVANVVREALTKESADELKALETAYEEAEKDPARKKAVKEWSNSNSLDDVEGWDW